MIKNMKTYRNGGRIHNRLYDNCIYVSETSTITKKKKSQIVSVYATQER